MFGDYIDYISLIPLKSHRIIMKTMSIILVAGVIAAFILLISCIPEFLEPHTISESTSDIIVVNRYVGSQFLWFGEEYNIVIEPNGKNSDGEVLTVKNTIRVSEEEYNSTKIGDVWREMETKNEN